MRMKTSLMRTLVVVVALGAAGACGGKALKPPTLQVGTMKFTPAGLTGPKLDVSFTVHNANAAPLVVESFRYDLTLNGVYVDSGFYATRMELAPNADQKIVSVFDLDWARLAPAVQSALQQQSSLQALVAGTYFLAGGETMKYSTEAKVALQR